MTFLEKKVFITVSKGVWYGGAGWHWGFLTYQKAAFVARFFHDLGGATLVGSGNTLKEQLASFHYFSLINKGLLKGWEVFLLWCRNAFKVFILEVIFLTTCSLNFLLNISESCLRNNDDFSSRSSFVWDIDGNNANKRLNLLWYNAVLVNWPAKHNCLFS